ncbi:Glutamate-1-semialdehyde aminotransferase [Indibacter alkaliphilus LW1]|uniref:Glutamate-1-semialdehyde 2,1-aminomutase n=1 Tax=Indibacter alkaliphilus (strain CCUG 57479 / KCTC 22604 / LW1) TaxID=1189612 RepID=S2DCU6_INDAL|nr:glutamate-1-semialdehyde 2,1-aminomutase [Indibacter alkaliphilus]EOZ96749.1 Glutamate-1-semialdehyde aminotransferase [Indibacter alkaliphilus LW1]
MQITQSKDLFNKAKNFIPGGVNSPVRAFRAVGGDPIFIKKADGAFIYDEDDNAYIELINSWGPMILGHNHPMIREAVIKAMENGTSFGAPTAREVEIAELIVAMVPSVEKVRMVNSGTEATMSAIRVARGFTGRDKFIKMEGHYHGHGDSFLISAGSGAITMGNPDSPGVTKGTAKDTLLAPYNDLEAIETLVEANKGEIAALILEPVPGNMGLVIPKEGYLQGLRDICDREGIVLIFDEVMTGFRLSKGGAQELFGVTPDMTTLGKIIGGGMPVGAYGGKKEIMEFVSPAGPVYQAGTLSGNPIAMAAGLTMLNYLNDHDEVYTQLNQIGGKIVAGIRSSLEGLGLDYTVNHLGSMYSLFFTNSKVTDFASAKHSDTALFGKYFQSMLRQGVYLAPSQFESLFLSTALSDQLIGKILEANNVALKEIHQ